MNKINILLWLTTIFMFSSCEEKKNIRKQSVQTGVFEKMPQLLDLSATDTEGLLSLEKQPLQPDSEGVIATISIKLPDYHKGMYYRPFSDKIASGNRMEPLWFDRVSDLENYTSEKPREDDNMGLGAFVLLQKSNGNYLAVLPLVSKDIGNTFFIHEGAFQLQTATYGTDALEAEIPLLAYAESQSPYEAVHNAWALAKDAPMLAGQINWRNDKTFPEPFRYLGWCSWEHYKKNIDETIITNSIKDIQQSDLPIRWVMVDDGYLDEDKGQLISFGVDKEKFPNGWKPILDLKDEKVKWMGIWRNFNGYMAGVSPYNSMSSLQGELELGNEVFKKRPLLTTLLTQESSNNFYELMTDDTRQNGFDIIKVDFQSDNWRFNRGKSNAIRAVYENQKALENQVRTHELSLINCIAMQNFNVFHQTHSSIIRSSVDYKNDLDRIDLTLVQNFTNALWLGHLHWTDQDMFHTSFKETAKLMAVARAVSGGPIYLSDETKNMDDTYLRPLMYEDGRILGTLAPAVPSPETLLHDPYTGNQAFKVFAPLPNKTAIVLAFNLNRGTEVKTVITKNDYAHASGMLQPFEGLWQLPEEGILLYDYFAKKAAVLNDTYEFNLKTREEKLVQLCPITNGWSIIGRSDKYLGASTFTIESISAEEVVLDMEETGPILIWNKNRRPQSKQLLFEELEKGLWLGRPRDKTAVVRYQIDSVPL